jgi:hypothetical protein
MARWISRHAVRDSRRAAAMAAMVEVRALIVISEAADRLVTGAARRMGRASGLGIGH